MNRYLFFATASGQVKRTKLTAYDSSRKAGLIAIRLRDDDELVAVVPTNGDDDILLSSRLGRTLRFSQDQVRETGRSTLGVKGLKFRYEGDRVVSCALARPGATILHVTALGYGKRTPVDDFNCKGRAGQGVVGIRLTEDRGEVVGTLVVDAADEILAVSREGVVIRIPVSDISVRGRLGMGVKVMSPDEGDEVVAVALVGDDMNVSSDQGPEVEPSAESDER